MALISDLPNATPQKSDLMEIQNGQTSSNNSSVGQLMQLSASENLAPAYDASAGVYAVGNFVSYNGTLYRCNTAIATPEAFDATKWTAKKVVDMTGEDIPVNTLTPNTSINSAINACFGRTGSDIAVSDTDPTSIAEAIGAITPSNTVLSAAWIVNSSSAFDTALTNSITVTAGIWMILWGHPTQSTNAGAYINGLATNSDIDDAFKSYDDGVAYSKNSMIVKFTGNATLQLRSGGSASVTFSNIERGYLKAYKLA